MSELFESISEPLEATIKRVVSIAGTSEKRSQQLSLGYSDIGHHCDRYLSYRAQRTAPVVHDQPDNWLAQLGTSADAYISKAFRDENTRLGYARYLVQHRTEITHRGQTVGGTCDLYDTDTCTVIDLKLIGVTKRRAILSGKWPAQYLTQVNMQAYGLRQAGFHPSEVALAMIPRNDNMGGEFNGNGLAIVRRQFEPRIAFAALDRYVEASYLPPSSSPSSPSSDCHYCPFFDPDAPLSNATCPGNVSAISFVMDD